MCLIFLTSSGQTTLTWPDRQPAPVDPTGFHHWRRTLGCHRYWTTTEPASCITRLTCAGHCSRKSSISGGSMLTRYISTAIYLYLKLGGLGLHECVTFRIGKRRRMRGNGRYGSFHSWIDACVCIIHVTLKSTPSCSETWYLRISQLPSVFV